LSRPLLAIVTVATLVLLVGVTWLAGQRAEVHVDDTEHLHVAARLAAGERLYVDVFQKQAGPFWQLLGPVVRAADGDGGRALALARSGAAACALVGLAALAALARALGASRWAALGAPALALASPNLARMLVIVRPDAPMWALALAGLAVLARHAAAPTRGGAVVGGALLGLAAVLLWKVLPLAALAGVAVVAVAPPGRRRRDALGFGVALAAPIAAWALAEAASGRLPLAWFFAGRFNAAFYAQGAAGDSWTGLVRVALAEIARVEPWLALLAPAGLAWLAWRASGAWRPDAASPARAAAVVLALPLAGAAVLAGTALPFESYFVPLEVTGAALAPVLVQGVVRALPPAAQPARRLAVGGVATVALVLGVAAHLDALTLTPPAARQYAALMAFEAKGAEVRHYPVFPSESSPARYHRRLWYRGPMRQRALETFCRLDASGSIPASIRESWNGEYAASCGGPEVR